MTPTAEEFAAWPGPYRPPWYPEHLPSPQTVVGLGGVTAYDRWEQGLEPGELLRLIAEHRAEASS